MDDKKVFDSLKGGRPDIRDESSGGFQYEEPKSPAITVREKADRTRGPLEFDDSAAHRGHNFSRHQHKPAAAEAIPPRNPAEIESNEWRPFNTGKGGINDIKDDDTGGHHYQKPEIPDLDYEKTFRGRK